MSAGSCLFNKRGWLVVAVAIVIILASRADAKPTRVVSMNLCTDQITLALADRDAILSISQLVAQPNSAVSAAAIAGMMLNHGLSEEIMPLEPDLVIAGRYNLKADGLSSATARLQPCRVGYLALPGGCPGPHSPTRRGFG
jgi:ABC-type hemin transport system substrate-binding protein